jgi:hypothetical protein
MPGKSVPPEKIAEAVTLRAAGYTTATIADRIGISIRTVNRICEQHNAKKGAVTTDLIEEAKRNLIDRIYSIEGIRQEAALLVSDDIAHIRLLRQRMADATEHLTATNLEEATLLMRGAAAYSTALKNTSDTLRNSLRTEKALEATEAEELPELVIRVMTDEEVLRVTPSVVGFVGDEGNDVDVEESGSEALS